MQIALFVQYSDYAPWKWYRVVVSEQLFLLTLKNPICFALSHSHQH